MTTPDNLNEITFGRYQLVHALDTNGLGEVYEARDPMMNRHVAIKLFTAFSSEARAARFQSEARAAMRLQHPNIAAVHEFGEVNGVAFLVTELVEGKALASYFAEAPAYGAAFTPDEAVRIGMELLDAIEYAHRNGVIHRAIQPANVLLSAGGQVKLGDFGFAGMDSGGGGMVDRPAHMAPEQIASHRAGPAADIFAAGVILYQLLTGAPPFAGRTLEALQQSILNDKPAPPSMVNPALHPAFDRVIARALAKRPEQRYIDALAMQSDLLRAQDGLDVAMPPLPFLPAVRPLPRSETAPLPAN